MKKKGFIILLLLLLIGGIGGLYLYSQKEQQAPSKKTTQNFISKINTDDDDEKIDWDAYPRFEYELEESMTFQEEGVYYLTGELENGNIIINTAGNIKLILDNVSITNKKGPAIYVENASDVVIETQKDSENEVADGETYLHANTTDIGAIYSHDDITFQGEGTLVVKGNKEDAIVAKDDLKFVSGTYEITAKDDGIRGKDSVYIQNGTFTITSQGDGIKSTNTKDRGKGYIYIQNGVFSIESTLDGIQSERQLRIENGTFDVSTGGGSTVTSQSETWGSWGSQKSNSAKGIKANENLVIQNGTFTIHSSDDALHSNQYIGIENGTFEISSGDDGIHADEELVLDKGTIHIEKSHEGLEASKITIHDGDIKIVALDDGINIAGGNDKSSLNRKGADEVSANQTHLLTIDGGKILVDSSGDGIDINGSCYLKEGLVQVNGPTKDGNGALDYDGFFEVSGGTLLASGSSGMMQGISESSTIYSFSIFFDKSYDENDEVTLQDEKGKVLVSYRSTKSYDSLVLASPLIEKGKTYTLKVNQEKIQEVKVNSRITEIGKRSQSSRKSPPRR